MTQKKPRKSMAAGKGPLMGDPGLGAQPSVWSFLSRIKFFVKSFLYIPSLQLAELPS